MMPKVVNDAGIRTSTRKEVSSLEGKQTQHVFLDIPVNRQLNIYDPHGEKNWFLRGQAQFTGTVVEIDGIEWVMFTGQGGLGVPLERRPRSERYIDATLQEAQLKKTLRYELSPKPFFEETN